MEKVLKRPEAVKDNKFFPIGDVRFNAIDSYTRNTENLTEEKKYLLFLQR